MFHQLLDTVKEKKPDLVVLIDYPGFNLRFAKAVKALGLKTFYYIAPQVWAWRQGRKAASRAAPWMQGAPRQRLPTPIG